MNYWPRWISAIRKRTADLSLIEMGAYDRLLDHYYAEEKPLPAELDRCYRLAGAVTKAEQEAVRLVLGKFFVLADDGHHNERADAELAVGQKKIETARDNGKLGGRPKGHRKKPGGFSSGNPTGSPNETHDATRNEPTAKHPHPHPHQGGEPYGSPPTAGAGEGPESATPYGLIARAIRAAGVQASPHHQGFRVLVDAGATAEEFLLHVNKAKAQGDDPWAYLLGTVRGQRERAKAQAAGVHQGAMPRRAPTAAEQRVLDAVPGLAAPHLRQQPTPHEPTEVIDVTARQLG